MKKFIYVKTIFFYFVLFIMPILCIGSIFPQNLSTTSGNSINNDLIKIYRDQINLLTYKNSLFEEALIKKSTAKVRITAYHPDSKGINSDSNPELTATMVTPTPGWTVAISSSLVAKGWLWKKVYIDGYGVFFIEDRMNKNLKGDRIDICVGTAHEGNNFKNGNNVIASILIE